MAKPGVWQEIGLALAGMMLGAVLAAGALLMLVTTQLGEQRLGQVAVALSSSLASELEAKGPERAQEVAETYERLDLGALQFHIEDRQGEVLGGQGKPLPPTLRSFSFQGRRQHIQSDEDGMVVITPVGGWGMLVVRTPVVQPLSGGNLAGLLGVTTLCALGLGLFGAVLLRRGVVKPLMQARSAAQDLASGHFGTQIVLDGGREFQDLAEAMTEMSTALETFRINKESRVQELEKRNVELQAARDVVARSQRLATVGRLAAGIAHELGNPLAAATGYTDLLLMDRRDDDQVTDLLERSQRELGRMGKIIRQLLDYARPSTEPTMDFEVHPVITESIQTLEGTHRLPHLKVLVSPPPNPITVHGHPHQLQQILVNVLLNAADALADTPDPAVKISVAQSGDQVQIVCRDNGPGFNQEALAQALEPFFTTKPVGQGMGLGLFVCAQLAETMGGSLDISNKDGGVVCLTLPNIGPQ